MKINAQSFSPTWGQFITLAFLSLTPPLLHNLLTFGAKGRLVFYALPGALFLIPLVLTVAWVIAYRSRKLDSVLLLMVAFVAISFQIDLIFTIFQMIAEYSRFSGFERDWGRFVYYVPYVWFSFAAGVAAIRLLELRSTLRFIALALTILLLGFPLAAIWRDRTLWAPPYDETKSYTQSYPLLDEEIFYLQPKILEQALAAIKPERQRISDLYFVGVAGYAAQNVFMNEVSSIGKLFEDRFDTKGRSILLINNPKTVLQSPIASVTAIRTALKRIGRLMNRNQDVLFLYLSSHGSRETGLSLEFWPLQFDPLDPKNLRKILDESGIKNRIIVVSACYSGMYVNSLKDENTLIITAAESDKSSFGCENEADFTYFGKAYFDEALRKTYSFTEAFELAKPRIANREKQQGYDNSNPQIFSGKNIDRTLKNIEGRLKSFTGPTGNLNID